ncbi:male-specific lethal 1 homolog [Ctenocephalides felis]|nr:male-specific lethal 1 homolog [Ctenocephalides felis]
MTSKEYHIAIGDVEFGSEEQEDVSIKDQSSILEVPRWCGQTYTSSNSVEGIENLDDSIIAKRHMKWEIEEKRRKRWDVQRIREQRTIERLKSRQSRSGNTRLSVGGAMSGSSSGIFGSAGGRLSPNGEEDVGCQAPESLWPDPHDARFIVLTEQLPVCALGANLPLLQPREFSLPWSTRSTARSPGGTESRRSSQTANRHRRQRRQRIKSRTKSLA